MKLASAAPTSRPAALPRVQLCPSLQSAALPSRAARLVVQAATGASKSPQDPFLEKTQYKDSALDIAFITLYTQKIAAQLNGYKVPSTCSYDDFVAASKELMKGRSPAAQHALVAKVLRSLMPSAVPGTFKALFPPSRLSQEINAKFAAAGFGWLVGEAEVRTGPVTLASGAVVEQASTVHIKKCRYLEASGCVGLCVNLCKVPTQTFFTEDFGLPLTMNPNFEDLSCDMIFGQAPPPLAQDPASKQPCFAVHCNLALSPDLTPCPRVEGPGPKAVAAAALPALSAGAPSPSVDREKRTPASDWGR